MSRFAANVGFLFTELPYLDRFAAAREAGFEAVEFAWPAEEPARVLAAVRNAGVRVALLNMPAGDLAAGERGWPNDPSRIGEWQAALRHAIDLARDVACPTVNVLAGNAVAGSDRETQLRTLERNLEWALPLAAAARIRLVTELLNRVENPAYLLATLDEADPVVERVGPMGWRLQLDTYHLGLTVVDVPAEIRRAGARIGHVQVADVPGRHQPGTGAIDWAAVRGALQSAGYEGPIGLEYHPLGGTDASLSWLRGWR
jgi:hydroxypyruvate isomerase